LSVLAHICALPSRCTMLRKEGAQVDIVAVVADAPCKSLQSKSGSQTLLHSFSSTVSINLIGNSIASYAPCRLVVQCRGAKGALFRSDQPPRSKTSHLNPGSQTILRTLLSFCTLPRHRGEALSFMLILLSYLVVSSFKVSHVEGSVLKIYGISEAAKPTQLINIDA
jgi:hypothetical protein